MNFDGDVADVHRTVRRKARKAHTCCACREQISPGTVYTVTSVVWDGTAASTKRCPRCETIHAHLVDRAGWAEWPDEELNCGKEYVDVFDTEPPPDIAALAFALPGEVTC